MIGGLFIVLVLTAFSYLVPNPDYVLQYMLDNPDKSSLYLVRNDSVVADLNGNRKSPLASTMKIIIAITYAEELLVFEKVDKDWKIARYMFNKISPQQ